MIEHRSLAVVSAAATHLKMSCADNPRARRPLAFFLQDLDCGGTERAIIGLAGEIARLGHAVDLVVGDASSAYRAEVSSVVNVVDFATRSPSTLLVRLAAYLRRKPPLAVMSSLDMANILLTTAAMCAGYKGRTIISQRGMVDASLRELSGGRRMLTRFLQRICFPRADGLISNSYAAARDACVQFGISAEKIATIHNAVDMERIHRLAQQSLTDQFMLRIEGPLIVSAGSLVKGKDMETLIKAFARVKAQRQVNLAIVGKGPEQHTLAKLVADLGLAQCVHLPGFDVNPYKWMAAAAVFVSASIEEGFPNVIAEALALGRPVVATDCPGDTARLLEHGRWGRLVPVADVERMAQAIVEALDDLNPPDGRERAADFSPSKIASAYLSVLLPKHQPAADMSGQTI